MVTRSPEVNELVCALQDARRHLGGGVASPLTLRFSRARLRAVRDAFRTSIRAGEAKLHRLATLLCERLTSGDVQLSSVVIGESVDQERFRLIQPVSEADLYAETDLELGNRLLQRVRMLDASGGWSSATLIANFVEYQPLQENPRHVHKLISRIKAEEELWNKVTDEIFRLDQRVARDKKLRPLSRYVKDVFGIKVVAGSVQAARELQQELADLRFEADELKRCDVPVEASTTRARLLEVKDYLSDPKRSGWAAIKTVVDWWDIPFEVQVQPLPNYLREREWLTRESHEAFRSRREAIRRAVAQDDRAFALTHALLRWLFREPAGVPVPALPSGVTVELVD